MAEFKKISDVDVINTLTDNDNVVIVGADGVLKQTSSGNLGMDITKTEVVEAPEETDNLVLVSNGAVKQIPAANLGSKGYVVTITEDNCAYTDYGMQCSENYDAMYETLQAGGNVWLDMSQFNGFFYMQLVCVAELAPAGLVVSTWNDEILFPNGSHNLPQEK